MSKERSESTSHFPLRISKETVPDLLGGCIISNPIEELPIDEERLEGRTALITGSTRGIGKATALLFGKFGMNVVIHGRDETLGNQVVSEVSEAGGKAVFVCGDLRIQDESNKVLSEALQNFPRIDIAVINAGYIDDVVAESITPEQWVDVAHGNLDMAWFSVQTIGNYMMEQDYSGQTPNIVYISSVSEVGNPGQANYSAAKAGAEAAFIAFARRVVFLKRDIAMGIVRPAGVRTEIITSLPEREARVVEGINKRVFPKGSLLEPDEVAHGIAYMAGLRENGHILTLA